MTQQEITSKALDKLNNGKTMPQVLLWVDSAIPLPECAEKRRRALLEERAGKD